MRRTVSLAVLATLATASPGLHALGLAEPEVRSSLSEPLQARIAISDLDGLDPSHLRVRLANAEAFTQAGLSRSALAESVQMSLSRQEGQLSVMLSTDKPVHEPYLDLLLALEWPNGTHRRQVTLLLDPPGYATTAALIGNGTTSSEQVPHIAQSTPLPSASPMRSTERLPAVPVGQAHRIEVKPGDTLGRIAERVSRPAGVSVEQMMMALFRTNQTAFPGGNINSLRAGAVLEVPAQEQLLADSASNARQQVIQQNQVWQSAGRDDTASTGAETPRLTLLSDAELAAEAVSASSEVRDSGLHQPDAAENAQAEASAPLRDEAARLAALEANWQASRAALAEVRDERDRLQNEIASLREDMDALREQLSQSVVAPPARVAEEPVQPLAITSPTASTSSSAAQATVTTASSGAQAKTGLWQSIVDQATLIGGGAIALLLMVWVIIRRRSQREPDEGGDYSFQQPMGDSGVPDFVEKVPATVPLSVASPSESAPQAETINEADIFIAYGRYEQACELLEKSLEGEPERHDLRLKLLIAYTELGMRDAAKKEAAHLMEHADNDCRSEAVQLMARFKDNDDQLTEEKGTTTSFLVRGRQGGGKDGGSGGFGATASEDLSTRILDETVHIEDAVDNVFADVERIIDYEPPSLEPEYEPRRDELQQPSVDFPEFTERSSLGGFDDAGWDIEEVAFEPLNLDNDQPATDTTKIKPER